MTVKHSSVIILYRSDSKILLQHRTIDAPTFPDYWGFFGGGIEKGESAEEAVKRECLEELGYELAIPRLFVTKQFFYRGNEHIMHAFVENYNGQFLTLREGQAMGWFLVGDTNDLLMNDHDRSIIQALGRILEPGD